MLGSALRQSLQSAGTPIVQLVRRPAAAPSEVSWNPDASRPLTDLGALEGCEAAVHLSGANVAGRRWTSAYKREIVSSRVASTHALVSLLANLRTPPRVLLAASATGIYGDRGDEILDERSAPGTGFLAETCQFWEEAAHPAEDAGIRVIHLRLGVVLAPGGGALARMAPLFRLGLGGRLGNGRQWMSWISLEDALGAIRFLMQQRDVSGPFNLTAPAPVRNADFTRTLAAAMHRPAIFNAPAFALRLALGEMANEALLASARVVPARLLQARYEFRHPQLADALGSVSK